MNVYLQLVHGTLQMVYLSQYASGSIPINNPQELVEVIEEICGKGSYTIYNRDGTVDHHNQNHPELPRITYWQQSVKTSVIEQSREVAKAVWGDILEMKIGWLEEQCRTYID